MMLYELKDPKTNEIICISTSLELIYNFIKQRELSKNTILQTITDKETIESHLIKYEYYDLISENNVVLKLSESFEFEDIVNKERSDMQNLKSQIDKLISSYEMKEEDRMVLEASMIILEKLSKKKRIRKSLYKDGTVHNLYLNKRYNRKEIQIEKF